MPLLGGSVASWLGGAMREANAYTKALSAACEKRQARHQEKKNGFDKRENKVKRWGESD
jgi:hypothetical protein